MLNQDFKEFAASCNADGVRYLVVGGYAVAFHGHPRDTKDLALWIEAPPDNAARLVAALEQFGFGSLKLIPADFLDPDRVIQLGYPPNRIELLTTLVGVDFDCCYTARIEVDLDGIALPVIDRENLKQNKRTTGRLQDLADVEALGDFDV